MKNYLLILVSIIAIGCCTDKKEVVNFNSNSIETPFVWENANIYFLLTDRFHNADTLNDVNFNRTKPTAKLRGFEGGDIKESPKKLRKVILQI